MEAKRGRAAFVELRHFGDPRGELVEIDFGSTLPFEPKRLFYIFGVPAGAERGGHAHRVCQQFFVCLKGSVTIETDDGFGKREYVLDNPRTGLNLSPPTWLKLTRFSGDAVLMVITSHRYDPEDYIYDYAEFLEYVKGQ